MYLDLYEIKQLSYNIINYKKIINTFYNNVKLKIKKRYEYFKYSIKYISLIKKIAKENNIIINKDNDNINYIFLNNNLQETKTSKSKTLSIIDSHLFKAVKIDGENINSIHLNSPPYSGGLDIGFILKKYSHDKGYRYLKYIKYYNINGDEFKLDISNDKIKIVDIEKFYYQEDFNSIIIIGKKLTYGDKINNDFIIKVYTLIDNVICWNSFSDLKTTSYRYKENNNTISLHTVISTIDVSQLEELKDIRNIKIELGFDGINIFEYDDKPIGDSRLGVSMFSKNGDRIHSTKKYLNIKFISDKIIIRDLTDEINFIDKTKQPTINPFSKLSNLKINNDINVNYEYIISDKVSKLRRELKEEIDKKEDKHIEQPNLYNCLKNTINDYFNPVKNIKDIISQNTESNYNEEIDFKSLGLCNNNYNRNFIPFN